LLSAHQDNIALNGMLFARVKAVYDQRAKLKLTPAKLYLLENTYAVSFAAVRCSTRSKKRACAISIAIFP